MPLGHLVMSPKRSMSRHLRPTHESTLGLAYQEYGSGAGFGLMVGSSGVFGCPFEAVAEPLLLGGGCTSAIRCGTANATPMPSAMNTMHASAGPTNDGLGEIGRATSEARVGRHSSTATSSAPSISSICHGLSEIFPKQPQPVAWRIISQTRMPQKHVSMKMATARARRGTNNIKQTA